MNTQTRASFLKAYDTYSDALFAFCYAQTGQRAGALDAVQEAFVRTWKYLEDGNAVKELRPFLYRTARNVLIDAHRRNHSQSLDELMETGFDIADDHGTDPLVSAQASHAIATIGQLPTSYRDVLLMRYVDDMDIAEIAQVTQEEENTISVRIHRGLAKLRELLGL